MTDKCKKAYDVVMKLKKKNGELPYQYEVQEKYPNANKSMFKQFGFEYPKQLLISKREKEILELLLLDVPLKEISEELSFGYAVVHRAAQHLESIGYNVSLLKYNRSEKYLEPPLYIKVIDGINKGLMGYADQKGDCFLYDGKKQIAVEYDPVLMVPVVNKAKELKSKSRKFWVININEMRRFERKKHESIS